MPGKPAMETKRQQPAKASYLNKSQPWYEGDFADDPKYGFDQVLMWWSMYDEGASIADISIALDVPTAVVHLAFIAYDIPIRPGRDSNSGTPSTADGATDERLHRLHWIPPIEEQSKWERKHAWASTLEDSIRLKDVGGIAQYPRTMVYDPHRRQHPHKRLHHVQSRRQRDQDEMANASERGALRVFMKNAGILPLR